VESNWAWGLSLIALTIVVHATGIAFLGLMTLSIRSHVEARSSLRFHHLMAIANGLIGDRADMTTLNFLLALQVLLEPVHRRPGGSLEVGLVGIEVPAVQHCKPFRH